MSKPFDRHAQRAAWHQLLDILCLGGPVPTTPTDDGAPDTEPTVPYEYPAQLAADERQSEDVAR